MEHNETHELEAIKVILSHKPIIRHNPFSDIPTDSIKKALALLEEYSEEQNF